MQHYGEMAESKEKAAIEEVALTSAIRETKVPSPALGASASNDVGLAVTLSPKFLTFEAGGSIRVATTLVSSIVVVGGQGIHSITAETSGRWAGNKIEVKG